MYSCLRLLELENEVAMKWLRLKFGLLSVYVEELVPSFTTETTNNLPDSKLPVNMVD